MTDVQGDLPQDVLYVGSVMQLRTASVATPRGRYNTLVLTAITNCVWHKTHVQIMNTMHDTGQQTYSDI